MALNRLTSKLVKHGQELLSSIIDSLKSKVDATAVKADQAKATADKAIEMAGKGAGRSVGERFWHDNRAVLQEGTATLDGQIVSGEGFFKPLYDEVKAGRRPTCTDEEWNADPTKRGCYVLYEETKQLRLPDMNGVQDGSIKMPHARGDGGDASLSGSVQEAGVPNIKGSIGKVSYQFTGAGTGAFKNGLGSTQTAADKFNTSNNNGFDFDASRVSGMYKDDLDEVRVNSFVGCWCVQVAGSATSSGEFDAMSLATRVGELETRMYALSNIAQLKVLEVDTPIALKQRMVIANPFGDTTPVFCQVALFHTTLNKYVMSEWVYAGSNQSHGISAFYSAGEGIIVQAGTSSLMAATVASGASQNLTANVTTASKILLYVYKVKQVGEPEVVTPTSTYSLHRTIPSMVTSQYAYVDWDTFRLPKSVTGTVPEVEPEEEPLLGLS